MANAVPFGGSDIVPPECMCHEISSPSSQVTVAATPEQCPSLQEEDSSMSDSPGIPEVPGRHKMATCRDVGFFAAASATHEAVLSNRSGSQSSDVSGATGDDAEAGMALRSSSNILPLKTAARKSDLLLSGTEGNSFKTQLSALERRESGISLSESLLLSVDLTTADLGTICDANDKNYYQQMVLRSLLSEDEANMCDSGRGNDHTGVASALNDEEVVGQEVQEHGSETVAKLACSPDAGYGKELVRVKSDERTSKFRLVQLNCSSQDVFDDAEGSNGHNSSDVLPVLQDQTCPSVNAAEIARTIVEDIIVNDVLHSTFDMCNTACEERHKVVPMPDQTSVYRNADEIGTIFQNISSGDSSIPSLVENVATERTEQHASPEKDDPACISSSDDAASQLENNEKNLKHRSVLVVEALFSTDVENSTAVAVRSAMCFTVAFILLYSPSTLINILTLYLQLLVAAIFVDIFLN